MKNLKGIYFVLAAVIVVSFFLPWISVESEAVGKVSKLLTGKQQAKIDAISGYKVPVLANSEESRFMISVIKIFEPGITDADKKSYLIWIVPLLAILLYGSYHKFGKNQWIRLVAGVIGLAIFAVSVYKISVTDLDKLVLKVQISYGFWLILLGYLGIGLIELVTFGKLLKGK